MKTATFTPYKQQIYSNRILDANKEKMTKQLKNDLQSKLTILLDEKSTQNNSLTDNDYRDILANLHDDVEYHQILNNLGLKSVSKYSWFYNQRATGKIIALQDWLNNQLSNGSVNLITDTDNITKTIPIVLSSELIHSAKGIDTDNMAKTIPTVLSSELIYSAKGIDTDNITKTISTVLRNVIKNNITSCDYSINAVENNLLICQKLCQKVQDYENVTYKVTIGVVPSHNTENHVYLRASIINNNFSDVVTDDTVELNKWIDTTSLKSSNTTTNNQDVFIDITINHSIRDNLENYRVAQIKYIICELK